MCKVSCDICKFSSPHDYVPNHYYCNKGLFFNDREPRSNCEYGEIDDWKSKKGENNMATEFIVLTELEAQIITKNGMVTCRMNDGSKIAITTEEGFKKWCDDDKSMCLAPGEE